jgi:hypothetical protein
VKEQHPYPCIVCYANTAGEGKIVDRHLQRQLFDLTTPAATGGWLENR